MNAHDDLHLLAGAYALGALDEKERTDFEAYLETSEEARAELASFTDTAVMLGLASEPVEPPPSLKASLMAQVAATPQLPATQRDEEADRGATIFSMAEARTKRLQRRWYARPSTLLAAAAAVIAIFVGGNVVAYVNTDTQQSQQAMSITQISAAADSQHASAAVAGGGKATLIWSNKLERSAVVMSGLPALPSGKTYELWYIAGSDATPAGTFQPGSNGSLAQVLKGKMTDGDTIGVTVEPAGGSSKPTTEPVVAIPTA
jgi:anti-sigma-K factor RskA